VTWEQSDCMSEFVVLLLVLLLYMFATSWFINLIVTSNHIKLASDH